ncbi:hypothetical protein BC834DRAFT_375535 [Gloeopeniophorella convolvens]|nr:hypothetical protein BC834DRAFT_375535 [Gloeopeniophorella convolvens]
METDGALYEMGTLTPFVDAQALHPVVMETAISAHVGVKKHSGSPGKTSVVVGCGPGVGVPGRIAGVAVAVTEAAKGSVGRALVDVLVAKSADVGGEGLKFGVRKLAPTLRLRAGRDVSQRWELEGSGIVFWKTRVPPAVNASGGHHAADSAQTPRVLYPRCTLQRWGECRTRATLWRVQRLIHWLEDLSSYLG